jgi:protein-S-isoprenylcysteine O-methyltransferase
MDKLEHKLGFLTRFSLLDLITSHWASRSPAFQDPRGLGRIALAGVFLGFIASSSLFCVFLFPSLTRLFLVIFLSSIYHLSEFAMNAYGHPNTVTYDNFLFYQSFDYTFVRIIYHLEYFLWYFLCPSFGESKIGTIISTIGLIGVIIGQGIRTLAMYQAGESFTHIVATSHKTKHTLVTSGVYQYFRHPSYFGWFLWATSLQLLLLNPVLFVLSIVVAYAFFSDRIPYEEDALVEFFGAEYIEYKAKTPTWIPFIK